MFLASLVAIRIMGIRSFWGMAYENGAHPLPYTVKILKFGTPQTIAIIVLKIEKFDVTLH